MSGLQTSPGAYRVIDKGKAREALGRIEEAINEALLAVGTHEPFDKDDLIKNFQIRNFLIEAVKY